MIQLFPKSQYRVVEFSDKEENYRRRFRPEQRCFYFFWKGFVRDGFEILKETFDTLDEANEFLYNYHTNPKNPRKKKEGEDEVMHEFNAVFHRLKKTDNIEPPQ